MGIFLSITFILGISFLMNLDFAGYIFLLLAIPGLFFAKKAVSLLSALLTALVGVGILYANLGYYYLSAIQFMVYIGGIFVLIVFSVFLTGGGFEKSPAEKFLGAGPQMGHWKSRILCLLLVVFLFWCTYSYIDFSLAPQGNQQKESLTDLGAALLGRHLVAFEVSSFMILVAIAGILTILRKEKQP